jgi:hypothetical protein
LGQKRLYFKELRERVWGANESVDHPCGGKVWLRPPEACEIPALHKLLHTEISPHAGSLEIMAAVFAHNRDSFWVVEHLTPDSANLNLIGFYSFLPLNAAGRAALEARTLDRSAPSLSLLVPFGEAPAAIYIWAIVARRLTRRLMPSLARAMGLLYADAPIFAFVMTEDGRKASVGAGFAAAARAQIDVGSFVQLPPWSQGGALA